MQAALIALDGWLLRTTLGGGAVLLVGALWMLISRQPVKRQRIGELALLFALLVALPAALPAWWSIPGSTKTDSLISYPGPTVVDYDQHRDNPREQSFVEEMETLEGFEHLEILGVVDEEHKPILISADNPDPFLQDPPQPSCDTPAGALLASTDSPWFRWMLRIYGLVYLGFVVFLLGRTAVGYYGLYRFWRIRRPAPAHVHAALSDLEPELTVRPRIGVCPYVHGPVSYGLWKPTILLPPNFCNEGDPEKLRWILAHELTHLRRRDAWGCLLLALGGAVYFHLPWFWWVRRQVRLAQEYVADAAAAQIASAVDYAQYLVSLTTLTTRPTLASGRAAGVFDSKSDLYRRVHMLLRQKNVLEGRAPRWWTLSAAASFLALAACTAGVHVHAADDGEKKQVSVVIVTEDDDDTGDDDKVKEKLAAAKKAATLKKAAATDEKKARIELRIDDQDGEGKPKIRAFRWQDGKFVEDQEVAKGAAGQWRFQLGDGKQNQQLLEAMKKIDRVLSRLKDERPELREQLLEVKDILKKLSVAPGMGVWTPDGKFKLQAEEARKHAEDAKKLGEEMRAKMERQARDQAQSAEARARELETKLREVRRQTERAAQGALDRAAKSRDAAGKDAEAVLKELEKAIAEKEAQLKKLKQGSGEGKKDLDEKIKKEIEGKMAAASKEAGTARAKALEALRSKERGATKEMSEELAATSKEASAARAKALEALRKAGQARAEQDTPKPRLGVQLAEVEADAREEAKLSEDTGILVTDVIEGTAAWNNGKGLKSGDILVQFAGKTVKADSNAFVEVVAGLKEGTYNAVVLRGGKKVTISGIKLPAPAKAKKGDDDEMANRFKIGDTDVIINLNDELAKLNKAHGDAVIKLGDVTKKLKDGKVELAVEVDGIRKNVEGLKDQLVTLKLDALNAEDIKKDVDKLVTLKLDGLKRGVEFVKPEIVGDLANIKGVVKTVPGEWVVTQQGGKPRLGIVFDAVPEELAAKVELDEDRGLYVSQVVDGSAAEKAGFQKGDILIEFNNKPISRDHAKFSGLVREIKPGTYTATVLRNGKEVRIRNIVLAEVAKPKADDKEKMKEWMVDEEKAKADAKREAAKPKPKDKDGDEFTRRPGARFLPQGGNRNTTVSVNNGEFTAKTVIDGTKTITVVGRVENNKATPKSITIVDGDDEKKYKALKDVPDGDREDVEKLLRGIRGSGNAIRIGPGFGGGNFGPGNFPGGIGGNFGPAFEAQMKALEAQLKELEKQLGDGNPGIEGFQKQLEEMRKQLRELNKERNRDKDDNAK